MVATSGDADAVRIEAARSTRLARPADLPSVVGTLVEAFDQDPVWSWAFPDPEARGHGIGMALLAHVVKQADAQGIGTYLESSNGTNDHRYESAGFSVHGSITVAPGRPVVNTMWRDPARQK